MSDLNISQFTEEDRNGFMGLSRQLAAELYERSDKEKTMEEYAQRVVDSETYMLEATDRFHVIMARSDGERIGYIIGGIRSCIPEAYMPSDVMDVAIVFVRSENRRQGVGTALVENLTEHARTDSEINHFGGYVVNWNKASLGLFRKSGFEESKSDRHSYFTMDV